MVLLHRGDVLEGAIDLLDTVGLDGVTTRKLGASLNLQGTAVYRHFANKEALLDAMADRLLQGVGDPLPPGDWADQLGTVAGRMRRALLAHRDGARVVAGTYVAGPNTRLCEQAVFGILHRVGVSELKAGWVGFALSHYVLGHTIEEQSLARLHATGQWPDKQAHMTRHLTDKFARDAVDATFDADPEARFEFGLHLLLDGIRVQLSSLQASSA